MVVFRKVCYLQKIKRYFSVKPPITNINLSLNCQLTTATEAAQWNNTTTPPGPQLEALKCLLQLGWPSGDERRPMPVFLGGHMGFLAGNPQAAASFPIT